MPFYLNVVARASRPKGRLSPPGRSEKVEKKGRTAGQGGRGETCSAAARQLTVQPGCGLLRYWAAQGLQGLHLAAAQGLHGLTILAAQGLQGLQAAAAQGLQGLHLAAAQGLQGLQPAAICTGVSAALTAAVGSAAAEVASVATLRAITVFLSIFVLPNKAAGGAGG